MRPTTTMTRQLTITSSRLATQILMMISKTSTNHNSSRTSRNNSNRWDHPQAETWRRARVKASSASRSCRRISHHKHRASQCLSPSRWQMAPSRTSPATMA